MNTKGVIAKVHAVRSKVYPVQQCRLSGEVVNRLGLSNIPCSRVFRATYTSSLSTKDNKEEEFYLFWLGDVSSHVDGVEVSQTLLNDCRLKEHSSIHICEVPRVSLAIDVRLEPLSKFDWDVVSTHASKIENTLLRDVSVVAEGSTLVAHVSTSVMARFKVTHIAADNSSTECAKVARLTNNTSLIISPFVDPHAYKSQDGDVLAAAARSFDSLDLPPLLAKISANFPLRVMPARHGSQNTGYLSSKSSLSERRQLESNATDILDSLTSNTDPVPSTPTNASTRRYLWTDVTVDESDINSVYIHPIVLKNCLEVIVARSVSANELQDVLIKHKYATWICALTPVLPTNMVSLARRVIFTDTVRPYYVVIPASIRTCLGNIGCHEKIQTTIFMRSQCVFPTAIRLCPLLSRDSKVDDVDKSIDLDGDVVDALVRFIDAHSSVNHPCMLSHNQTISLDLIVDGEKRVVQDYVLQLDVKTFKTSDSSLEPSLRHVMFNLLDKSDLLYQLLPVITVAEDHPLSSLRAANNQSVKSSVVEKDISFEEVMTVFPSLLCKAMLALLPCLLPSAIEATVQERIFPHNFLLLTGKLGSGKSTLLKCISKRFQALPNVMTQCGYVDCSLLKDLSVDRLLSTLTEAFQTAKNSCPYVLCLDNLDVLVKSSREGGLVKDEKALLVSMHISRHLQELRHMLNRGYQKAIHIFQSIDPIADDSSDFARLSALHKVLEGSVVVLASATTLDDLDSVIFGPGRFQNILQIPSLQEGNRYETLLGLLKKDHVSIDRKLCCEEKASITRYTEGFVIGDLVLLCNSLRAQAYNRAFAKIKEVVLAGLDNPTLSADLCIERYATVSFDDLFGQLRNFSGATTASSYSDPSDLSWNHVGGYDELKQSILDMIRSPVLYKRLYSKIPMKLPKAILLYGMPGTGKTHLARAAGREFGMGFLCVRGPQLLDKYIGASEKAVRDLFVKAQDMNRPVLIFFDEFEALAARRGKDNTGITDRVVNQLLTFIDGVDSVNENKDIYIIAATSRPELVDPALLRPGRIDKHICVQLPDEEDRKGILMSHLRNCAVLDSDGSAASADECNKLNTAIGELALASKGMTAADLKSLVNTAYLHAVHDVIEQEHSSTAKVCLQPGHLLQALKDTKPSLSDEDISMYESIYSVFQGQDKETKNEKAGQPDAYKIFKQQKFTYK